MERCHEHLVAAGYRSAVLWVLRDNPRARRFYERTGWSLSVGRDGRQIERLWQGPVAPGAPQLPEPLPKVQYRIDLV